MTITTRKLMTVETGTVKRRSLLIELDIPRDRKGEFEPQIVKKNQTDISNIEDQVLSMYAKGMTTRDIFMSDRIIRQSRVAIGVKLNGQKEVLGLWVGSNESAKYWLGVLTEVKNRGVQDIFIVSVDGLTGFGDAISAVFPKTEIQCCIVHQIHYTTKFVSYKDIKVFIADLKDIYQAFNEDAALSALDIQEEKWGAKYPSSVSSWRNNWSGYLHTSNIRRKSERRFIPPIPLKISIVSYEW